MRTAALLILVGFGCACSRPPRYGREAMPAAQAKAALAGQTSFRVGHVDRALHAIADKATATSPYSSVALTYRGLRDGKVCFSFPYFAQYFRSRGTQEEAIAERLKAARAAVMTFELRPSLEDTRDWPASSPPTQITTSRLLGSNLEQRRQERGSGTSTTTEWLETTIEICGNAPSGPKQARYMTATSYPGTPNRAPTLFVWVID